MRYDAIVIGSGPAGLEAALNLKIRAKSFLLFGAGLSAKIEAAPRIDNYLGLPGITGKELAERFAAHLQAMDITVRQEQVSAVFPVSKYFSIASNRDVYEATAVVLATGTAPAKLLEGEEALLGHGVGYCATCDAPLYRGKTVAVLGWNEEAVYEANFVAQLAKTVYYIPMKPSTGELDPAIRVVEGPVRAILGEGKARGLALADGTLDADGIFILRDTIAPSSLVPGIAVEDGFVKVDAAMRTSIDGLFAAGDCTGKPHQYMRAAGQGQTAALNAAAYIDLRKRERQE